MRLDLRRAEGSCETRSYRARRADASARAALGSARPRLAVPLVTPEGHALGTVCVFGDEPREWTPRDVEVLTEVSRAVMSELELRRTLRRMARPDTPTA